MRRAQAAAALAIAAVACTLVALRNQPPALDAWPAAEPAAMLATTDGGILFGERLTGRIRQITADGALLPTPVATVDVSTDGHRGLLGLAQDSTGRLYAAWTDPELTLTIAVVRPGPARVLWHGPRTAEQGNGGSIAFLPDGRLLVGIGDLQQRELVEDPDAPNGKLLVLDPAGVADQRPEVLASGWTNPFAFDVASDGSVWVADNATGGRPERLARVAADGQVEILADLPERTAPSGLSLDDDNVYVCGFASRRLLSYDRDVPGAPSVAADDCELGVIVLSDERIAYASRRSITVLPAQPRPQP